MYLCALLLTPGICVLKNGGLGRNGDIFQVGNTGLNSLFLTHARADACVWRSVMSLRL